MMSMTPDELKDYRRSLQALSDQALADRLAMAGLVKSYDPDKIKALCLEAASRLCTVKLALR